MAQLTKIVPHHQCLANLLTGEQACWCTQKTTIATSSLPNPLAPLTQTTPTLHPVLPVLSPVYGPFQLNLAPLPLPRQ